MPHGYPLHIDATCDRGRGGTFLCLAGWTGWVLHAVRIASENAGELRPAVERTLAAFGDPLAVMRDLGAAGAQAVAACRRRDIPDLLCHFHFLAAVGHKLLDGHLVECHIVSARVRRIISAPAGHSASEGSAHRKALLRKETGELGGRWDGGDGGPWSLGEFLFHAPRPSVIRFR